MVLTCCCSANGAENDVVHNDATLPGISVEDPTKEQPVFAKDQKSANKAPLAASMISPKGAPSEGMEFTISLQKGQNDVVGADVYMGDADALRITGLNEGLVSKWNKANPQQVVKIGDRIIEVNGKRGDSSSMMQAFQSATTLKVVISRPSSKTFTMSLTKGPNDTLGLNVDTGNEDVITIVGVEPGLVSNWNKANPDKAVKVGDLIAEANGKRATGAIVDAIKSSSKLEIVIESCAGDAPDESSLDNIW